MAQSLLLILTGRKRKPRWQLAVRISGRWKEQEQSDHVDNEGNRIISSAAVHSYAFKDILSSLRLANLLPVENQSVFHPFPTREFWKFY
jgi:hypothetical protein